MGDIYVIGILCTLISAVSVYVAFRIGKDENSDASGGKAEGVVWVSSGEIVRMKKSLFLLMCLIFVGVSPAHPKELRVATEDSDYYPFYFMKEGRYMGATVEIIQKIAGSLGYEVTFHKYPWSRALKYVETGRLDMMIQCFRTPERSEKMIFADGPTLSEANHLFVKKGSDISFASNLKDMTGYKFGAVRNYSYGNAFDNADYLGAYRTNGEKILIKMLIGKRFDIAIGSAPSIIKHAKELKVSDQIVFLEPPVEKTPAYMAFSKKMTNVHAIVREFSEELKKFKRTEEFRQIIKKYYLL